MPTHNSPSPPGEGNREAVVGAGRAQSPHVATIPLHADFGRTLARRLLAATPDPLALARTLLLLPNRRAARALTQAFVAASEGRGLLLPRMIAVADLDDADAALADGLDLAIPAAISPDERRFALAGLLARGGQRPAAALHDAASLARALDTLQIEERTPADLAGIDVSGLAHHWAKTTARLDAIAHAWPAILAERGLIDPAARRVALAHAAARRWSAEGSAHPVIAAGIANAPPFVAALLRAVARLSNGQVVLPGLDLAMADAAWDTIDPADPSSAAHPQAALKALLETIGVARAEVSEWDDDPAPQAARVVAAARALDPAAFTDGAPVPATAFADIRVLEAASPAGEAQAIALALREALETPGRTAALVTPDRALAARVRAHLARWDIDVDDSAGTPLGQTPPGIFLRLLAEAAASGFAPVPVLALLKHPFAGHPDRAAHLEATRAIDLQLRRPPPPPPGLAALGRLVPEQHAQWWASIRTALTPPHPPPSGGGKCEPKASEGEGALAPPETPLPLHIATLTAAATALAGDRPWTGPQGRALADTLDLLAEHGAHLPAMLIAEAAAILDQTLAQTPVRPQYGGHPRVAILGLLEARLQRANLTILGGLNEGVWPATPAPDPWLPPLARRQLGLPPLEARIGLAAHDFLSALGSPQVLLTRARRDATAPASASRFLLRLQAAHPLAPATDLLGWAHALDAAPGPVTHAPRPAPAPRTRPTSISVTQVDTLRADPFAFYASAMLRLRPLDALAADLTPSERGRFVHKVMERWFHEAPDDPARLPQIAAALFARRYPGQPRLAALWQPRLLRAVGWAAEQIAKMAAEGWRPCAAEAGGEIVHHGITLKGRADRIDIGPEGQLGIIDYKTGQPPSNPQILGGFATQLGLLGTLIDWSAIEGVQGPVERLGWWKLGGGRTEPGGSKNAVAVKPRGEGGEPAPIPSWTDAPGLIAACWAWYEDAVDRFLLGRQPFTAKLHPEFATGHDFDQLARVAEWQGRA